MRNKLKNDGWKLIDFLKQKSVEISSTRIIKYAFEYYGILDVVYQSSLNISYSFFQFQRVKKRFNGNTMKQRRRAFIGWFNLGHWLFKWKIVKRNETISKSSIEVF